MKTLGVIVTFNPQQRDLGPLVEELCSQATEVMILDNTPAGFDPMWAIVSANDRLPSNLRCVRFGHVASLRRGAFPTSTITHRTRRVNSNVRLYSL